MRRSETVVVSRETESSNPAPSSVESAAEPTERSPALNPGQTRTFAEITMGPCSAKANCTLPALAHAAGRRSGVPRQSRIALVAPFASSHLTGEARHTATWDGKAERKNGAGHRLDRRVGRLVARKLGQAGARVLSHGRDAERGARVKKCDRPRCYETGRLDPGCAAYPPPFPARGRTPPSPPTTSPASAISPANRLRACPHGIAT